MVTKKEVKAAFKKLFPNFKFEHGAFEVDNVYDYLKGDDSLNKRWSAARAAKEIEAFISSSM